MHHLPKFGPLITVGHGVAVPFHEYALLGKIRNYVCLSQQLEGDVDLQWLQYNESVFDIHRPFYELLSKKCFSPVSLWYDLYLPNNLKLLLGFGVYALNFCATSCKAQLDNRVLCSL
jgi:hypothetical protein